MERIFQGRILIKGNVKGSALVSHEGLNPLAAWKDALLKGKSPAICGDQNNQDLYKKQLDGKILCLPKCIGSTTAGLVLQTAAEQDLAPKALLFSKSIDSLAASGIIFCDIWVNKPIITVDRLGDDFLQAVHDDMEIEITDTGLVTIRTKN
ncbi:MAG: aconitase X swivel domain-containing protein [Promethearchaeota archaeon]